MKSNTPTPPTKDDVLAILKAHRDLGPEFDSHLADQIIDLWHHPGRVRRRTRLFVDDNREGQERRRSGLNRAMPVLGISIPLLAIAGGIAHAPGVMAVLGLDAMVILLTTLVG